MLSTVNFSLVLRLFLVVFIGVPLTLMAMPDYRGSESCLSCHQKETADWQGSPHQLAMQLANKATVLGDFDLAKYSKDGVVTTFFREQDRFMVNTDSADGSLQDFEIAYVFGVYPLQQYMVQFPKGKIQVLDIAWDARPQVDGGQRWYSLHPDETIPAGDVLHWTGPNLNWNYMCADCHSTNLQKNYDAVSQSYQTTWTDINVSCEACHGPGSEHKKWADAGANSIDGDNKGLTVSLNERDGVSWHADSDTMLPIRSEANDSRAEIEVCARCHSRRSQLSDDFVPGQPFLNAFHPALLTEGLYYADGQMQDEVYVWGSFQQSKMFKAGVTCSDCHDPHSTELKAPGDQVCAQCHAPVKYASEKHHFHAPDSVGSSCIACHMPATTLMGIDERNDHGFRIPQPDVSAAIDAPNACSQCHVGRTSSWADTQMQTWYGKQPRGYQRFAPVLAAFRAGNISASRSLLALAMDSSQPAIARATAYSGLGAQLDQNSLMALQQGLNDTDPLVRQGALSALESVPMQYRIVALPAVWDEVRAVRIQAARLLAAYPADDLRDDRRDKLNTVLEEYIQTQLFNAERPEAQVNLASLYVEQGRMNEAEQAFRQALILQPQFVPAYVNFAQMLGSVGRESESKSLLEAGIAAVPESSDLYHALGLSQVRQKNNEQALVSLARAAQLDANNRRYQYVYAVALQSAGEVNRAVEVLQATLQQFPGDLEILYALATYSREAGAAQAALSYAKQLQALLPNDQNIAELVRSLQ